MVDSLNDTHARFWILLINADSTILKPNEESMTANSSVYQLKINLEYIEPPIWRRVLVPASMTFEELHYTIQVAMGWTNSHLHQFMVGKDYYGELDDDTGFGGAETYDESAYRLGDVVAGVGSKFRYEYDFGDSWLHQIVVEKIMPRKASEQYPTCVTGERNCPPEDCGGPPGYEGLLEALADPNNPEHEDYLDWLDGEEFDPEDFNPEHINKVLAKLG
jgi:hypothetical protein